MSIHRRNWLMLLTLGAIWGGSFVLTKFALRGYGPISIGAGRLTIGAAFLLAIVWARGGHLPRARPVLIYAAAAAVLSNALPFSLLSWAQLHVDSAVAGVFMAVVPLFVLPLSHLFVPGERMTARKTVGFLIGFSGVAVLMGPTALEALGGSGLMALGQLACAVSTLCYATGAIVMKTAPRTDSLGFGAVVLVMAAAIMVPAALIFDAPPSDPFGAPLLALIALGALPTGLALVILLKVLETAGPPFLSLVNYQVPVWAVLYGALLLDEPLNPRLGTALALILAGLFVAQLRRGTRGASAAAGPKRFSPE